VIPEVFFWKHTIAPDLLNTASEINSSKTTIPAHPDERYGDFITS
jgi:hypothetical protein